MTEGPRPRRGLLFAVMLAVALAGPVGADELVTVTTARSELSLSETRGYLQVTLRGAVCQPAAGAPMLPQRPVHVLLPPGQAAAGVEVIAAVPETIRLAVPVQPCPGVRTVGDVAGQGPTAAAPATVNGAIYASDDPYPGGLVELAGQGDFGPYRMAAVALHPLRYVPSRGLLLYYPRIDFAVRTVDGIPATAQTGSERDRLFRTIAAKMVVNPGLLARYDALAAMRGGQEGGEEDAGAPSGGQYQYLIVTTPELQPALEPLAAWKTQKGVPAKVVTTDWIRQHGAGADPAEALRSFIKGELSRGVLWVLLAGPVPALPHRSANGYPSDLYFSDMDGDWNANRNSVWGETADSAELYPDVFVGRLPASDAAEAANMVGKILAYERAAAADYQTKLLFIGADLYPADPTPTGAVKDSIQAQHVSAYPNLTVDKLYPTTEPGLDRTTVLAALNQGYGLVNFSDHADYYSMGCGMQTGGGQITLGDVAGLSNAGRPSVIYAIGCYNGAFDHSCIGQRFLGSANGACAFIACSREAWYIPGDPYASVSYLFDRQFFSSLLSDSVYNIGAALGMAKASLIPSSADGLMRWSQYEINLLGDPEMAVWTDSVRVMLLGGPDSLMLGADTVAVTVADSVTGSPVAGARVCLQGDGGAAYAVAFADPLGVARFIFDPRAAGTVLVTATARNYRPRVDSLPVGQPARHAVIAGCVIVDSSGNGDGIINPGETFGLRLLVRNNGTALIDSLRLLLATADTMVGPDTAVVSLPTGLAAGDSAWCAAWPLAAAGNGCPDGYRLRYDAAWVAPAQGPDSLVFTLAADSLALEHFTLVEVVGDGDGRVDSGEVIELRQPTIGNYGNGRADGVTLTLTALSPDVVLLADSLAGRAVPPRQSAAADSAFRFVAGSDIPCRFGLSVRDRWQRQWTRSLRLFQRPMTPALTACATDPAGVKVGWDAVPDAAGYVVYRSPADTAGYAPINPLLVKNCLYYVDRAAGAGIGYAYRLASVDSSACASLLSDAAEGSGPPAASPGWPNSFGVLSSWNWNSPVAGDIDGDGRREVVMAGPNGVVHAWDPDGASLAGWPATFGTGVNGPVALADLDGDQRMEIIVAYGSSLSVVDGAGSPLPGWPRAESSTLSSPVVCDLDRDGALEVIVACGTSQLLAYRWDGATVSQYWSWTLPSGAAPKVSVGDVRGGSRPEVVVTNWSYSRTRQYILDHQGMLVDSLLTSDTTDNAAPAPALLADIDADGKEEALISYLTAAGVLCAWDSGGAQLWRTPVGPVWSSPSPVRPLAGGTLQIAVASPNGSTCLLDHTGAIVPGWPKYWRAAHGSAAVADLDGDGSSEVLVHGDYGSLNAWGQDGAPASGYPLFTADGNYSPATLCRLTAGGPLGLLADGRDGRVWRWPAGPVPRNPPEWPLQGHDIMRTCRAAGLVDYCGHIGRSLTLSGDNWFCGDVVVDSGATLTVRSGSRLYFADRRDFDNTGTDPTRAELIIRGRLVIAGTADDSVFCDTWSGTPCDSSWHGVRIEAGGEAEVDNCGIRHARFGLYYGTEANPEPSPGVGSFRVGQCRPNPARAAVVLDLELPAASRVAAGIYNVAGQRVRVLADGVLGAGSHRLRWDGCTHRGTKAAAGVYLVRVQAGGRSAVRKAVVLQ